MSAVQRDSLGVVDVVGSQQRWLVVFPIKVRQRVVHDVPEPQLGLKRTHRVNVQLAVLLCVIVAFASTDPDGDAIFCSVLLELQPDVVVRVTNALAPDVVGGKGHE